MVNTTVASSSLDSTNTTTQPTTLEDESSSMFVTDILKDVDSTTSDFSSGDISDSIFSQNGTVTATISTESTSSSTPVTFSSFASSSVSSTSITPAPTPPLRDDGDDKLLLYILIPVCLIVVIGIVVLAVCCLMRRRKARKKQNQNGTGNKMWANENQTEDLPPAGTIELRSEDIKAKVKSDVKHYRAIHKFEGQEEGHLNLEEGDTVIVREKAENGWLLGHCGELSGWFPESYVEILSEGVDDDTADSGFCERQAPKVSSFMLKKKHSFTRSDSQDTKNEKDRKSSSVDLKGTSSRASVISTGEKFYKAVYDYTAAYSGEISLKEGVVVMGREVDKNGWMRGVKLTNGDDGWFPAVYVDEITEEEAKSVIQKKSYKALKSNRLSNTDQDLVGIEHIALFPYTAERDDDLTLEEGDKIVVFETLENGWWLGCKGQEAGWFPGSFVELLRREQSEKVDSSSENNTAIVSASNKDSASIDDGSSVKQAVVDNDTSQSENTKIIRPARKAPLPPSAKKSERSSIPEGEISTAASVHKSIDENEKTVKPARRAPVPPADNKKYSLRPDDSDSGQDADSRSSSATPSSRPDSVTGSVQSQKPYLPPRWVKPSVIKVPRKKLDMMNLSDRPTRPLPPAPGKRPPVKQTTTAPHAVDIRNKGFAPKAVKRKQVKSEINPGMSSSNDGRVFATSSSKQPAIMQRSMSQPSSAQDTGPYRPGKITKYISDDIVPFSNTNVTNYNSNSAFTQQPVAYNNSANSAFTPQPVAYNNSAQVIQKTPAVRLHPIPDKSFIPTYNKQYLDVQIALNNVENDVPSDNNSQAGHNSDNFHRDNSRRPLSVHDNVSERSAASKMASSRTQSESDSVGGGPRRPPPPKQQSLPNSEFVQPTSWQSSSVQKKGRKLKQAIAGFTAEAPDEISFTEGSFIREISKVDGRPGWSLGMLADGTTGLYPTSYVGDTPISLKSSNA